MAKVLIVESPNKVKKIREALGSGWEVYATSGHFRDMPEKPTAEQGLGYDAATWAPFYVTDPDKKARVEQIKTAAKKADKVYLATDPDREGEAIAWHLVESLRLKSGSYLRAKFSELTQSAIKASIANAGSVNTNLVKAQEARRVLDRMVGYRVSGLVKSSAGRVQSPALRLIVDREREIAAFKPTNHFTVVATSASGWTAGWNVRQVLPETVEYLLDRKVAEHVATTRTLIVTSFKEGKRQRHAPDPFTTVTLMRAASTQLKWDADRTAKVAQKLFEDGHITYHRTDKPVFSDEAVAEIRAYLQSKNLPIPTSPRKAKSKEGAQEAHEGIRPSHIEVEKAGSSPDELALYALIRNRTLASQMEAAAFATRQAVFTSGEATVAAMTPAGLAQGMVPAEFKASGETLIFKGWKEIYDEPEQTAEDMLNVGGRKKAKTNDDPSDAAAAAINKLPVFTVGDRILVTSKVEEKRTKAPARFTEATLLERLEVEQIGRPSTYSSIMQTLKRKFVTEDKGRCLIPNDLGKSVIDILVNGRFSFVELGFTRLMEAALDEIVESTEAAKHYLAVMKAFDDRLTAELARSNGTVVIGQATAGGSGGSSVGTATTTRSAYGRPALSPTPTASSTAPKHVVDAKQGPGLLADHGKQCPKCKTGTMITVAVRKEGPNFGKRLLMCGNRAACEHREFPVQDWKASR